jgi:hypothetical protein
MTHRASLGFVLGIVLIDMLGFGIVIPVFPGLIMHLAHVSITQAAQYAGWLSAGYAVCSSCSRRSSGTCPIVSDGVRSCWRRCWRSGSTICFRPLPRR